MVKNGKNRDSEKAEILDLCMDSKNAQKWVWIKSIKMEFFENRQKWIIWDSQKNGILGPSDIP